MMIPERHVFGATPGGAPIERITLRAGDVRAEVITYGAALQALHVPDREGQLDDIVLGFDDLAGYVEHRTFYGATVGRVANRIAGGRFDLDGKAYHLAQNEGQTTLHGGPDGFDRRNWQVSELGDGAVTLEMVSAAGDQGFPGQLLARACYALRTNDGGQPCLTITYEAETDAPTLVSMTNHSFFALAGISALAGRPNSALEYRLKVPASRYLTVDEAKIPTGVVPVGASPFDFRDGRQPLTAVRSGALDGYDHCLCLDAGEVELSDAVSGRVMWMSTNLPGLQVYTGNFLDGTVPGKGGYAARKHDAICLEPQIWPDAINMPESWGAQSPVLRPGELRRAEMSFCFGTR
ncbi:aldose epimerase family protein [Salipiger sp. PrR002]|uniref:aldose epimerase family protein n=1 Tax=Salipiger sp. PrR002 TaxID=2706489 RepID=UPI0013BCA996|nr:aldose epimerase family protein [Salipiger sp. PrR002]NDV98805.1 galactose mutarotase [Salipiger sp. PrR002]NDW55542.1 galactose mutarotase [Salipiger sp. PrR004]